MKLLFTIFLISLIFHPSNFDIIDICVLLLSHILNNLFINLSYKFANIVKKKLELERQMSMSRMSKISSRGSNDI